jgi:ATP-dependent RNA helicase DDX1
MFSSVPFKFSSISLTLRCHCSKNGISLGPAFELPEHFKSGNFLFPSVSIKNSQLSFNFGATSLKFAPPAGCLPIAQMSAECLSANVGSDKQGNRQQAKSKYPTFALIIEPTRELADQVCVFGLCVAVICSHCSTQQVFEEITKFKKYLQSPVISHAVFIGGNDIRENLRTLHDGVHIVIGTPGRISTLISDGNLSMSNCQFLILDEADRLLDTGNSDTILSIFKRMSHPNKQVSLFSATLHSPQIKDFSELVTRQPIWIDLKGKDSVPETVDHAMLVVHPSSLDDFSLSSKSSHSLKTDGVHSNDKLSTICPEFCSESIKLQKPKLIVQLLDAFDMEQCLIFCRTKLDCDNLEQYLNSVDGGSQFRGKTEKGKESSYSCTVLHADRTPAERKRNFQAFKDGDVRCLICTDVAARGLDIAGLPFVINMTLPSLSEDYIHRIGRVGRAECVGLAISLVADCPEKVWYHTCASKGRGCRNVNLTSANGCCIWQEETEYLKVKFWKNFFSLTPF